MRKRINKLSMLCLTFLFLLLSPIFFHPSIVQAKDGEVPTSEEELPTVKLNVSAKALVKDKTFTLKVYNAAETQKIYFKSSDSEIAEITKAGVITAKKIGTATITVTVKDSLTGTSDTLTCEITVGPPAISIKLTMNNITLSVGKRTSLKAILKPNTTAEIAAFCSLNPDIATVSASGKVTAKSVGDAIIVSSIENGTYDICTVSVVEPSEEDKETPPETDEQEVGDEAGNTTPEEKPSSDDLVAPSNNTTGVELK